MVLWALARTAAFKAVVESQGYLVSRCKDREESRVYLCCVATQGLGESL